MELSWELQTLPSLMGTWAAQGLVVWLLPPQFLLHILPTHGG